MNRFIEKISKADTIAILGHVRPDGDCVGSTLGLSNYIKDNFVGKRVQVYLEAFSDKFSFLQGADEVINSCTDEIYDLAISLDCGDTGRHGELAPIFANARDTICLDHHRSNTGFGDYFYCDPDASSCCEVLCRHIDKSLISKAAAECLYLGIVHDTGVFKYKSTSEETMQVAGMLMSKGIDTQYIIDDTFYKTNYGQTRMTGEAMMNAALHLGGKAISTCVTCDMFSRYGCTKDDTDGIVDKIRVVDGVEVAIFVYEIEEKHYKFSLRSVSRVDVSRICVAFGGGGHIRAAGFDVKGDYDVLLAEVLKMISEQL